MRAIHCVLSRHIESANSDQSLPCWKTKLIDSTSKEVMKAAILSNSASIIVSHNHPSQDPTPSREDVEVTKRLAEAGKLLGIELLDHMVVCDEKYVSLKEKGHI